jgi:hypothetical protein
MNPFICSLRHGHRTPRDTPKIAKTWLEIEMEEKSMGRVLSRFRGKTIFALPGDNAQKHHAEHLANELQLFYLKSSR